MATDRNGVQRFAHVEIEICSHCDCKCWGCDRFINTCPTSPMTVPQVRQFVQESLDLDWEWERIHILGGEPTLHTEFREIVQVLLQYKERFPHVLLRVISNGYGKLFGHRDWLAERGVEVSVEAKKPGTMPAWFVNTRMAPVDENPALIPVPPCGIFGVKGCGLGLTRHGFFLCGAGASIARVLGKDIGVMRLEDVTYAAMKEQAKAICHLCGHWNPPENWPGPKVGSKKMNETGNIMSPFWDAALKDWNPLPMPLYRANDGI